MSVATSADLAMSDLDTAFANYEPDTELEKKLVRKLDKYILPPLWLMCLLAFIDRNNIGNAKAAGMSRDLDLSSSRYAMLINVFFIAYVILEVPSNLILARFRPSWYLPALMVAWGSLVAGMSQVQSYRGILVIRFFLGLIEAGFMPGVMLIMSCWYKKNEIGKRFSIFFTAICIAGAISGLLSGAIISGLEGVHGMTGWRWLFLLEGIITIGVAAFCKFILLDYPLSTRRLTPAERQLAYVRILHDKQENTPTEKQMSILQSLFSAMADPRTYFFIVLYLLNNGVATISYFIPTVIQDMGYRGTGAQWMTVPLWLVATVFLILVSLSSDRTQNRQWHIVFGLTLATISGIIIVTVKQTAPRYAFICFYVSGVFCAFPLILTWTSETMAQPIEKRAVAIALVNGVGDLAALYGSRMWPDSDAPDYKPGFTAMVAMCGGGALITASVPFLFNRYLPSFPIQAQRRIQLVEGRGVPEADMMYLMTTGSLGLPNVYILTDDHEA
ncbi:hypothetical protein N7508_007054 [Penicillium antarcticum]|uniref:uncharacterized protein n=1 Tax=Penicillium antarcticum TaxID=416450 RepID=UPI002396889C|nr:uncharacterized protein N7508_007054 [Penicillium antarcticum]KAJ5302191.1 hypothetical protein N7508_007054 [Penicillium antarcticum]